MACVFEFISVIVVLRPIYLVEIYIMEVIVPIPYTLPRVTFLGQIGFYVCFGRMDCLWKGTTDLVHTMSVWGCLLNPTCARSAC